MKKCNIYKEKFENDLLQRNTMKSIRNPLNIFCFLSRYLSPLTGRHLSIQFLFFFFQSQKLHLYRIYMAIYVKRPWTARPIL